MGMGGKLVMEMNSLNYWATNYRSTNYPIADFVGEELVFYSLI